MEKREIFYQYSDDSLFKDKYDRWWTYFFYVNETTYMFFGLKVFTLKKKVRARQRARKDQLPRAVD